MVIDLMFKNGYKTSGFPLLTEEMAVAQMAQGEEAAGLLRKSTQGQLSPSFSHTCFSDVRQPSSVLEG